MQDEPSCLHKFFRWIQQTLRLRLPSLSEPKNVIEMNEELTL
ncbi:hypothetical protein AmDm5_1814 [Acetobacter malorum]|uniref:Uncharacterized protein n=1 Tax=Acetobacter malorum TaxID=178901 RepID=A0A087PP12_9PROT|nr:hypothetical protein AmDm5_1814 [Acetobacter malorum]OAG77145.1 hypothetical protein Amal_01683 [Acetobacter malorum]